jgi:iron(III) transport system substrate-binding protein
VPLAVVTVPAAMRRLLTLLLPLVVAAPLLAACGDEDKLTIYSGRTENLIGPLLERFADETGLDIAVRYGDSAELALLIDEEGDRTPADVFISQSPGALGFLAGRDRLAPVSEDIQGAVDARFEDPEGAWVGLSGRVRVLVWNTELVDEADLPASVFDLTDPAFRGRVGIAPENGSFQDFVSAMRADVGDEETLAWLEGMEANDSPTYGNNNAIVEAVARGEVEMGLVNHYYNERRLAEDPDSPTANHLFADGDLGSLILSTGVGMVAGTNRADDVERFIEFLLSEEAQTYFSEETFEYPLAAGVEPAVQNLPPLESIAAPPVDLRSLGGGLADTRRLIERSGLEGS